MLHFSLMNRKKIFIAIGVFWLAVIGGFFGFNAFTSLTGKEVVLKIHPVDPRDLFRGDYVRLGYDISTIDLRVISSDGQRFHPRDTVYVALDTSGAVAVPTRVSRNQPADGLAIRGVVTEAMPERLQVEYGIESYFLPEHKGLDLQRRLNETTAVVAVDSRGHAVLKSLLQNGTKITFK